MQQIGNNYIKVNKRTHSCMHAYADIFISCRHVGYINIDKH